jgi:hypothetical protein
MRSVFLIVAAFTLVPLGAVSSQAARGRIRITAAPNALDTSASARRSSVAYYPAARVLSVGSDSLFLLVAPADTLAVALAGVSRLEVSTGRRRYAKRGAGIGALIGVASGVVMGYASGDDRGWCCFSAGEKAFGYGVGLGLSGLIIGSVIGAFTVSDRWTSVPLGVSTPRRRRSSATRLRDGWLASPIRRSR